MRRSAAPSQINSAAKRSRFSTPFCSQPLKRSTDEVLQLIQGNKPENKELSGENEEMLCNEIPSDDELDKYQSIKQVIIENEKPPISSPIINIKPNDSNDKTLEEGGTRYYNVVWCKPSKKKHKKWEDDAVLIVKGRSLTLKDMEGKQIGQANANQKTIDDLESGNTFVVGGKEIEIVSLIKDPKGSCFLTIPEPLVVPVRKKPENPLFISKKPLYDPTNPNAFILTPPNENHQLLYNSKKLPLVDVVVDPRLTLQMRLHQKEGVLFLYECVMGMHEYDGLGAILADEMGLGKTLQCIVLIWTLLKQGPYGGRPVLKKVLIVTPSSLVQNWVKEFDKWLGKGRLYLYAVDQRNSVKDYTKTLGRPVMIISYEMLMRSCDIVETMNFDLIICDEGHRLKNTSVKTTSSISSLSIKRRIILTGTPVQNDLQEYFALVEFCNPGILGSSASFHRIYEEPISLSRQPNATQEEIELGEMRAEELMSLTALFTLRRTQEIINKFLPPKVENVIFCKPSALQISLMNIVLNSSLVRNCLENSGCSSHPFICISALKKICNHPALFLKQLVEKPKDESPKQSDVLYSELIRNFPSHLRNDLFSEKISGKMNVLARILSFSAENCNERFVLVSGFTKTLDIFEQFCHKNNYQFLRLDGSTSTSKRQTIVDTFNKSSTHFIFLLSSKAGGVGFNLIGASRIILFDIDWNPANDLQAKARVWRDGQTKTVHIYRFLTTGSIEEKIFQRQVSKQNLSDAVMDQIGSSKMEFTKEELRDLFTFHENTSSLTHDQLNCKCLDDNLPEKHEKHKSNLNMNELLQWSHFSHPNLTRIDDKHLESAGDHISFVFQTKTN
uniref:DNA repair and recombination protein RAD54-like n=1 Tax=Strigamia maritima TaxID=126957 RepID=T1J5D6_STRMM